MTKERRPAIRTLRGWAISVLDEAGAIREYEEHGWMQDRADPHARERALAEPRQPDSLRTKRPPRFETCWTRSGTPARSARPPSLLIGVDRKWSDRSASMTAG
jgi:hypothetical protein